MKNPTSIKIGYTNVAIFYVDNAALEKIVDDPEEQDPIYGVFLSRTNEIYLWQGLDKVQLADTFLHECLHAHSHILGVRYIERKNGRAEETAINCTSAGTVMIFQGNPKVFRWWVSLF